MSLRTILIVEPNPGVLIVGRNVLARAGFTVTAVSSVEDALAHARRHVPDVVLLDGRTAEPEILRALGRARSGGVPVVLTAQKGKDHEALARLEASGWARKLEIADVIEKPFVPERLLQAVERALERAAERAAERTDPRIVVDAAALLGAAGEPQDMERTDRFQIDLTSPGSPGSLVGGVYTSVSVIEPDEWEKTRPFEALLDSVGAERALPDRTQRLVLPSGLGWRAPEPVSTRFARLLARLDEVIREERIVLDPSHVIALAHACDAALSEEDFFEEGQASLDGELAFGGYLEHLPIDQLLQLTASVAQPARLRIEQDEQAVEIFFRNGQIVFARQDNMPEGFMLGRVLAASGFVSQPDLDRSLGLSELDGRRLTGRIGQRLLAGGLIQPRQLADGLRRQVEELVFEAVRWTEGRFSVFAKEALPPEAEDAGLALPVQHLLLEGMRRLDELRRIKREVGERAVLDRDPATTADVLESLRPEERLLLEHVDGRRTVEDLVRSVRRPPFDVYRALQQLRGRRLVTVVAPTASA